jgi:hypothetical protein
MPQRSSRHQPFCDPIAQVVEFQRVMMSWEVTIREKARRVGWEGAYLYGLMIGKDDLRRRFSA